MKLNLRDNKGQSTIEFALTMILIMAFTLFYFQLSLVFGFGNYVHYATFMSARAYLSAGGTDGGDQISRAQAVLIAMLQKSDYAQGAPKFPQLATGVAIDDCSTSNPATGSCIGQGSQYVAGDRSLSWMQGVRYKFRSRLFVLPLAGMSSKAYAGFGQDTNSITLTSESWLGVEPNYQDCQNVMGKFPGIFDNGC